MPIILTFDDSPSKITDDLLEFLDENNIKAVFFGVGQRLIDYSDEANKILKKGHIIGNHSFTHPHFSTLNLQEIKDEIVRADNVIDEIYKCNQIKRVAKYFRFPYGDKGVGWNPIKLIFRKHLTKFIVAQNILQKLGYSNFPKTFTNTNHILKPLLNDIDVFSNFNPKDWQYSKINHKKILKKIVNKDVSKNFILQLHDKKENFDATILIIKNLVKKGAKFELPHNLGEL